MGGLISCIEDQVPPMQRLRYDLTPIKSKSLPIVWLVGPPGSGRDTQGKMLCDNLEYSHIKVANLLRDEADRDTDRGRLINEALHHRAKKIPDCIVVDLIKEEMLRKSNCKGYLINNFPKNSKQGSLFIKEIEDVDVIVYLICDTHVMVNRTINKSEGKLTEETIKKSIAGYIKEIKEGISRYGDKIEKIRGNEDANDVYTKIEAAISVRIKSRNKITAESDYAQSQENESQNLSLSY